MIGGIFGDKLYKFDIVDINMFKIDNYKSLGLYMTIYNFLPNIGIVLNNNTEILESVTDVLEKENDKKNPLHILYKKNLKLMVEEKIYRDQQLYKYFRIINRELTPPNIPSNIFKKQAVLNRIIKASVFYISFCFILYYMGNLFESTYIFNEIYHIILNFGMKIE